MATISCPVVHHCPVIDQVRGLRPVGTQGGGGVRSGYHDNRYLVMAITGLFWQGFRQLGSELMLGHVSLVLVPFDKKTLNER